MVIDSASNKKIKLMESLRLRKHREREGLFRIEGVRLAEMAAESGWELRFGLYTAELLEKERGRQRRAGRLAGNRRGRPAGKAAAIAGWQGEWLRYPCRSRRSYCSCCSW